MTRMTKLLFTIAIGFLGVATAPPRARADQNHLGYVCTLTYGWGMRNDRIPGAGSAGYAQVNLYSGPACAGNFVGSVFLASPNATICSSFSTPQDLSWLQTTIQNLTLAASQGVKVEFDTDSIGNPNIACAYDVNFTGK
jgi:hypothetical protein